MEISHHSTLTNRANNELVATILEAARVKSPDVPLVGPSNDGLVRMPGIKRPGGINALIAPPTGERAFELKTRAEACNNGWPQDTHFKIEKRRKIPLVGSYVADRLHGKMVSGVLARRAQNQHARF